MKLPLKVATFVGIWIVTELIDNCNFGPVEALRKVIRTVKIQKGIIATLLSSNSHPKPVNLNTIPRRGFHNM